MTYRTVDPLDSAFITLEVPSAPLHIGAILELDVSDTLNARERFEEMKASIAARVHEIPVLTQRILRTPFDLAWPVYADDPDFDIDDHVIRRAVSAPGGEAELDALVGRVMGRELVPDRPLWELNIIEGLADGRVAVVLKIHHALADGVSGAATFARLFDITPEGREPDPVPDRAVPAPLPSPLALLSRTAGELVTRPGAIVEAITAGVERAADVVERIAHTLEDSSNDEFRVRQPSVFAAPRTSINGTPSHSKNFTRLRLSLPDVKTAARSRGASVTDFVMATVSGGLRKLFEGRDETLSRDLVAFVPVNVRRQGAEGEMGNQIAAMLLALRTDLEPEERIRALTQAQAHTAERQREHSAKFLMNVASAAGPTLSAAAGRTLAALHLYDHLPPVANVVVSSVPGPPIPLWLSGHRVASAAPLGPLMAGLTLNVTVLGYCDYLEYGLLGCARRVPEINELRDYIADEAEHYLTAAAT